MMKTIAVRACAGVLLWLIFAPKIVAAQSTNEPRWDTYSDTWVGSDRNGKDITAAPEVGPPRAGKIVAMFYFLSNDEPGKPIWDNTKILKANPNRPVFGDRGAPHWWGEPWFGYYISSDEAVIRKHIQMLTDAGVDVLIFDNTNGTKYTYPHAREAVCNVLEKMKAAGLRVPRIAFFTGNGAWSTDYHDFYEKHLHEDLWFKWQGRPLMMVHEAGQYRLDDQCRKFFSVRNSWAWPAPGVDWYGQGKDAWPWLDNYPQHPGWHDSPAAPEEMSICVAQHATTSIGRSFHAGREPALDQTDPAAGLCFAEQAREALRVDPQLLFVTGWNEWTALRFIADKKGTFAGHPMAVGDSFFVDEYNPEFSRDIEPVKGGFEDDYYYKLIDVVRRFKGVRPVAPVSPQPISLDGNFAAWRRVTPEFRDDIDDPVHRDSRGWGDNHYINNTGRNDLVAAKVSFDDSNIYFYVRTKDPISSWTDPNWMLLYLRVRDGQTRPGWLNYNFVVNRSGVAARTTSIERNLDGKYHWGDGTSIGYIVAGNEMELEIPRKAMGIERLPVAIDFKWADGILQTGDASDFTLNGDVAPNDRFNYRAILGRVP